MIEELQANNNGTQEEATAAQPAEVSFPHKYQDILNNLIKPNNRSSPETLLSELGETGIFDQPKKHRYWVDEEGNNCFMVYAKALTIAWGEDSCYWCWYPVKATSHVSVDVAQLLDVCWLDVHGAFETGYLTPGTAYEVSYVIMLKDPNYGWENQVDFSLTLPQDDLKILRKYDLGKLPKRRWSYIPVGEFTPSPGQSGRMEFVLRQTLGNWKKGLVIKGVDIRPKI